MMTVPREPEGTESRRPAPPGEGSPRRIEALSDGIFAIVMTLIVLQIHVPSGPARDLVPALESLLPTLLTYLLTFVTLGMLWFGNRTQSHFISTADHPLVWLNLAFLGAIALIPFSAALLSTYPTSRFAVIEYGAHLTVASAIHGCIWLYAVAHPALLAAPLSPNYVRRSKVWTFAPAVGYALGTGIGAINPLAGIVLFALVPVPFVTGIFYRGLARAQ